MQYVQRRQTVAVMQFPSGDDSWRPEVLVDWLHHLYAGHNDQSADPAPATINRQKLLIVGYRLFFSSRGVRSLWFFQCFDAVGWLGDELHQTY